MPLISGQFARGRRPVIVCAGTPTSLVAYRPPYFDWCEFQFWYYKAGRLLRMVSDEEVKKMCDTFGRYDWRSSRNPMGDWAGVRCAYEVLVKEACDDHPDVAMSWGYRPGQRTRALMVGDLAVSLWALLQNDGRLRYSDYDGVFRSCGRSGCHPAKARRIHKVLVSLEMVPGRGRTTPYDNWPDFRDGLLERVGVAISTHPSVSLHWRKGKVGAPRLLSAEDLATGLWAVEANEDHRAGYGHVSYGQLRVAFTVCLGGGFHRNKAAAIVRSLRELGLIEKVKGHWAGVRGTGYRTTSHTPPRPGEDDPLTWLSHHGDSNPTT